MIVTVDVTIWFVNTIWAGYPKCHRGGTCLPDSPPHPIEPADLRERRPGEDRNDVEAAGHAGLVARAGRSAPADALRRPAHIPEHGGDVAQRAGGGRLHRPRAGRG